MNFFPIGTHVGTVEVVNTGKINPMLLLLPLLIRFIHSPLIITTKNSHTGADLGGGCRGCAPPPPPWDDLRFSNTTGILQKMKNYVVYWCWIAQETSAPPPKKNPGSAPATYAIVLWWPAHNLSSINFFPIAHNTLCLPPKYCITYCLKMLLGKFNTPRSI